MTESEQTLIECPTCGAAVLNTTMHEAWHAKAPAVAAESAISAIAGSMRR